MIGSECLRDKMGVICMGISIMSRRSHWRKLARKSMEKASPDFDSLEWARMHHKYVYYLFLFDCEHFLILW